MEVVILRKYDPLRRYLSDQQGDSCTLTFSDIERIIRASLPSSARKRAQWWGNDKTHTQALSWMLAGWSVERPNLSEEYVFFTRFFSDVSSSKRRPVRKASSQVIVRNLDLETVTELKRRAKGKGHSLQQELRNILTGAVRPQRRELIAEADRIRAMTTGPLEDSVSILREDRDSR